MTVTGSFTTATPLAPNLASVDVAAQITTYSFSDGINTYTPPNGRIIAFQVSTDASGVPTANTFIDVQVWTTGTSPHKGGDRFSEFFIDVEANSTNNVNCTTVGPNGDATDACTGAVTDTNSSNAQTPGAGAWSIGGGPPQPTVTTPVPTLSQWGLMVLTMMVIALGWLQIRRRR